MGDYGSVMLGVTFIFAALMTWCVAIDANR